MYDQTGKLWFKIIAFIVLEAFLFTIADVSWAANYRDQRGSQQMALDSQKNKKEKDNVSADALSNQLVLTQPAMPYMGFGQITPQGQQGLESISLIDTTISGLSIAGNDLSDIFTTLKSSGCSVSEAGFGAMRQGFAKKEIYHALISAGYDKDEVKTLLGSLLKMESETKKQDEAAVQTKTGPPQEQSEQDKTQLNQKKAIFEIPSVTDLPIEKDVTKIVEKTVQQGAVLRQTVEFVRLMINEGKRGKELIKILKKAGLSNERITTALSQLGFNLKDIITILKDSNISCTDIVQAIYNSQVNYSDKDIYTALLKAGFSDQEIINALRNVGMNAADILKLTTELGRSMTQVADAMVKAGFNVAEIATAYVLKAMQWTWDNSVNVINCAVKAFDAFLNNVGRKFSSKQDLAYELIVDDILATGEVLIQNQDVMTSMVAIKNVAQNHGIDLEGYNLSLNSLLELEGVSVVHLDGDHWVTLVGIDGDQVTIIDNGTEEVISLSEFQIRWDGNVLAFNQQEISQDKLIDLQMREIRGGRGLLSVLTLGLSDVVEKVVDVVVDVVKKVWDVIKVVVIVVVAAVLTYVTAGALAPVFVAAFAATTAVAVAACTALAAAVASFAVTFCMGVLQGQSFGEAFKSALIAGVVAGIASGISSYANFSSPTGTPTTTGGTSFGGSEAAVSGTTGGAGAGAGAGVGAATGSVASSAGGTILGVSTVSIANAAISAVKQTVVSYALTKLMDAAGIDNVYLRAGIVGAAGAWAGSSAGTLSVENGSWSMATGELMTSEIAKQMLTGAATQISMEAIKQQGYKQGWDPLLTDGLSLTVGTFANIATSSALDIYNGKEINTTKFTNPAGDRFDTNFSNLFVQNFKSSVGELMGALASKAVDRICLQNNVDPILSAGLSSMSTSLFTSLTNFAVNDSDFGMTDIGNALRKGAGSAMDAGYKDYLIRDLGYTQAEATQTAYGTSLVFNMFSQNLEKGTSPTLESTIQSLFNDGVKSLGFTNEYNGSSYNQTKYLDTFDSEIDTLEYMMYASDAGITLDDNGVYRNSDGSENTYMNRNKARTEYNQYWKEKNPEVFDRSSGTATASTGNLSFADAWTKTLDTRNLSNMATQSAANFSSGVTNLQTSLDVISINAATMNTGVAASFGYNGVIQLSLAQGTNVNPAQAMQNLLNYGQNATKIYGANGKQIVGLMFENSDAFFRNKASAYQAVDTSTPWIRNQRVYTSDTAYKDVGVQANSIKDLVSNQNLSLVSYSTNSFQTDLLSMAATSSFAVNGSVVYDQLNNIFMLQNATFTSDSKQETVDFSTKLSNGDKVYFSVQSGNGFNNAVLKTSAAKDAAVYTTRVDGVAKELKIGDITSKASDKVSSLEVALTVSASGNLNLESASLKDANKILASENKLAAEIINLPSGCIVGNTTLELANSTNGLAVTAVENIDSNRSIKYSGEDAKITSKAQFVYNRDGKITSIVNKDISGKNLGVDIQTQKGSITLFDNQISFANQNNSLLTNLGSFFGMSSAEEFTIIKGEALAATNYQIINSVEQQQSGAAGGAGEAPGLNKIILIGDANGNQYIQQGSMFTIENNNWAVKDNDVIHNNSGKTITVSGKAFENGEIAAVHKGNIFKATVADDVKDRENIEYKLDVSGFNLNPLNIIQVADTVVSLPIGVMNANDIYLTDSGALTITQNIALQGPDVKGLYISAANTTFTLNSDGNQALKTEFSQIGLSGTLENQGAAGLKVGSNQLIGNTQVVDNNLSTTTAESNKIKINVTEDASYYQGGQVTLTNSGLVYKPSDILEITGLGSSAPNFNANTELYSGSFVSVGNLKLTTDGSYKITQNSVMTTNADSKILITLLNQSGQNVDTIMNLQEVSIPETNKTVEYSTPDFQNFSEATAGMSFSTQGIEFTIQDKGLNKFEARSQPISAVAAIELKNKDSISSKIDFKENVELTISPLGSIVTADNVTFNQVNTLKSGAEVKVNQDKSVEIVSGQINLAKADALKGQNSVATIQPDKNKEQNKKDNDTKPVYVGEAKIDLLGNNKYDLYGDLSFNKDSGVYLADNTKVTINNLAKDGKDFVNIGNTRAVAGTFGVSQGQITAIAGGAKLLEHITKSGEYITLEYKGTKQVSGKSIDQGWKINASQAAIDSKESWSGTIQGQSVNYSLAKKNNETIIQINNGAGVELKNQTLIGYGNQELKNVTVFATQKLANGNFVYTTTDEKAIGFQQLQSTSAGGPASQMLGKTIVSISDSFDNGQRIRTYGAQTNGAFCLTFTADKELKGINVAEQLAGSSLEIVGSGAKVNGETFLKGAISYNWNGKEIASSYSKGTTLLEANTSYGQVTREYLGADSWKFNASQSAIDNKAVWKGTYRNQSVDYNVADKNGETIIQINKGLGLKVENQTIVGYGKQELKNVDVTVTQKLANGQFVYTTTDKDAIGLQQLQSTSAGGAASQMQGRTIASVSDSLVGGKTVRTYGETSVKKDGINFALTFTADQYLSTAVNVSEQLAGSYLEIAGSGAKIQGKDIISGSIDYAANDKGVVVGTFSQGSEQYQGTIKGTNLKVISVYNGTVNGVDKGWTMQYQGIGVLKEGAAKFDVQINGKTFEATLVSSQEGYSAQINQNVGMNKDFVDSEGGKHGDVELFATQLLASGNVEYMAKDKGKGDWKQEITAGVAGAQIKYEGANNLSVKDQINADGKTIRTYTAANDGNFQIVFVADR
ncbi:MAG: hypothetical protein KJ915_00425, partial [Candidatus Omnitrophica bacterium]|nr:hypothetical protein [Candidatus Omnitrophota bacterium]